MTKTIKLSFILIVALSMGCVNSTSKIESINAITDISEFTLERGENKLNQVTPVSAKELYGEWEVLISLVTRTLEGGGKGNTMIEMKGNMLKVETNGNLTYLNNTHAYSNKSFTYTGKWSLTHKKTVFNEDYGDRNVRSFKVRVQGDTMEWINPLYDENLSYIVLVKR